MNHCKFELTLKINGLTMRILTCELQRWSNLLIYLFIHINFTAYRVCYVKKNAKQFPLARLNILYIFLPALLCKVCFYVEIFFKIKTWKHHHPFQRVVSNKMQFLPSHQFQLSTFLMYLKVKGTEFLRENLDIFFICKESLVLLQVCSSHLSKNVN